MQRVMQDGKAAVGFVVDKGSAAAVSAYTVVRGAAGRIDTATLKRQLGKAYTAFASAFSSLLEQSGYAFSDLFGDPAGKEEDYKALTLVKGCENAVEVIQKASERTKISANYLLALARQESGCRSDAKANGTTAAGMFQFVESTWLIAMRDHGADYGETRLAEAVGTGSDGQPVVRVGPLRDTILAKRHDAQLSAYLAAELARENAAYIKRSRNKPLAATDLYMAHFLGAGGATKFLAELDSRPQTLAHKLLPSAAKANPTVFFIRGDRSQPRSVDRVYGYFKQRIENV